MVRLLVKTILRFFWALSVMSIGIGSLYAAEIVNYSGRLVQSSGAPVTGNVDLTVKVFENTTERCLVSFTNVPLTNGVFNLAIDFENQCNSGADSLSNVIQNASGADLTIEITDVTNTVTYPQQPLNAVPFALTALTTTPAANSISFSGLNTDGSCNHTLDQYLFYAGDGRFICKTITPGGVTDLVAGTGINLSATTGSITVNIAAGGVSATELATDSVTTVKIVDANVTTAKIADANVTTAKIADSNVTDAKIVSMNASKLTGTAAAIDGSNITNISNTVCTGSDYLAGDGTCITPTDNDTTYTAGAGLDLTTGTFSIDAQGVTNAMIAGIGTNCANGEILKTNGLGSFYCATVDLGDHIATQDIDLATFKLVGNGGTDGIYIDAAGNVGIGNTAPGGNLDVVQESGASTIIAQGYENTTYGRGVLGLYKGRGTATTPLAVAANDRLGTVQFQGHDGTTMSGSRANVDALAAEAFTPAAQGTHLRFATTAVGTTTQLERMRVTSEGSVGIGTNSPSQKFHLYDSSTGVSSLIENAESDGTGYAQVVLSADSSGTDRRWALMANGSDGTFRINEDATTASTRLSIIEGGNVGIGINNPTEKLDVVGNIKASGDICAGGNCLNSLAAAGGSDDLGDHTATQDLVMGANNITFTTGLVDGVDVSALDTTVGTNTSNISTNTANITSNDTDIAANASAISTNATNISNKEGTITAGTTAQYWRGDKSWQTLDTSVVPENSNLYFTDARARTAAVLNSTAGTETDQAASVAAMKTYVTGLTGAITSSQWTTSGSDVYYNGGNVGVGGVPASGHQLHVQDSTADTHIRIDSTSNNAILDFNGVNAFIEKDSGAGPLVVKNKVSGQDLIFGTDNINRMVIDENGNVGIGTLTPGTVLDVSGTARFDNTLSMTGGAITSSFNNNYVPINVTNPTGYSHIRANGFEMGGTSTSTAEGYIKTSDNSRSIFLNSTGVNIRSEGAGIDTARFRTDGTFQAYNDAQVDGNLIHQGNIYKNYQWGPLAQNVDTFLFKTAGLSNGSVAHARVDIYEGANQITRTILVEIKNSSGTNGVKITQLGGTSGVLGIDLKYANQNSNTGVTEFYIEKTAVRNWQQRVMIRGVGISTDATSLDPNTLTVVNLDQGPLIDSSGNTSIAGTFTATNLVGDGSGLTGVSVDPAASISLSGDAAKTLSMGRHTTADTAGASLGVVAGGATVGATDKNGGTLELSSGTSTGTGSSSIEFKTATASGTGTTDNAPTTKMTLTGDGDLGLGTTTPAAALEVANGGMRISGYNASNLHNGFHNALEFTDPGHAAIAYRADTADELFFGFHSNGNFYWGDDDEYLMTLSANSGNLSLGGGSDAKLHVTKTAQANKHDDNYATAILEDTEARLQLISDDAGTNAAAIFLTNVPSSGNNKHWSLHHRGITNGNRFDIAYGTTTGATDTPTALSEYMSFLPTGKIGIGDTNPMFKLTARGTDDKDAGPIFNLAGTSVNQVEGGRIRFTEGNGTYQGSYMHYDASQDKLHIGRHPTADNVTSSDSNSITVVRSTGYVGVGTDAPESMLDVKHASGIRVGESTATDAQWGEGVIKKVSASENYIAIGTSTGTDPDAANNVEEALNIQRKGNVGIGTTTPSSKLEVNSGYNGGLTLNHYYSFQQPNWAMKIDGQASTPGGYLGQYGASGGYALSSGASYYGSGEWFTDANATAFSSIHSGNNGIIRFMTNDSLTSSTAFTPTVRMELGADGNLGVGTAAPDRRLVVADPGNNVELAWTQPGIKIDATWPALRFASGTSDAVIRNAEDSQGRGLQFGVNSTKGGNLTKAMQITGDGNVGIGDIEATHKFQVNNNSKDYFVNRKLAGYGNTEDAAGHNYILLHRAYEGTLLNDHYVNGKIHASRGSTGAWNRKISYEVNTACAYNSCRGSLMTYNEYARLKYVTYSTVKYLAIQVPQQSTAYVWTFTGFAKTATSAEQLRLVYDQDVTLVEDFDQESVGAETVYAEKGFRNGNFGRIKAYDDGTTQDISVPWTNTQVSAMEGRSLKWQAQGPKLSGEAGGCNGGDNPGYAFDDTENAWNGTYEIMFVKHGGNTNPIIHLKWSGWNSRLLDAAGAVVKDGVGEVEAYIYWSGSEWQVQHMMGRVGNTLFSCH